MTVMRAATQITLAVHPVFNYPPAYSEAASYAPLAISPVDLAATTLAQIQRETDHARAGRPARIIAKMNALLDKNVIQALYRASQEAETIDLNFRGICSLRPRLPALTENPAPPRTLPPLLPHTP